VEESAEAHVDSGRSTCGNKVYFIRSPEGAQGHARRAALFSAGKQNVGAQEDPERIVGDERDLDEYADKREQRDEQRNGKFHVQRTFSQLDFIARKRLSDSGFLAAEWTTNFWRPAL